MGDIKVKDWWHSMKVKRKKIIEKDDKLTFYKTLDVPRKLAFSHSGENIVHQSSIPKIVKWIGAAVV